MFKGGLFEVAGSDSALTHGRRNGNHGNVLGESVIEIIELQRVDTDGVIF